jgi:hypothetical protein
MVVNILKEWTDRYVSDTVRQSTKDELKQQGREAQRILKAPVNLSVF